MKIGYFCSEYPALSHTFIAREIDLLATLGVEVVTASANRSKNLDKMTERDQERARTTEFLKATPPAKILATLLGALGRPGAFFRALGYALAKAWRSGPRSLGKALAYFVQAVLLDAWARREGVSHIHVHFANPAATVALIGTRLGRYRFSLSVHGPDEFYDEQRMLLVDKVREAVFVRTISYFCRSQLMRLVPSTEWGKFSIIRCGLAPGEIAYQPRPAGPLKNILCVGRVCSNKGQAVLVKAFERLKDRGIDGRLLFLGGGEELETIRDLVKAKGLEDRVEVAGPVGHDRVKAELARADVFVLPSFAEGIPVVLMEAMAAGLPVVTTHITGVPELIENRVEGFLTEPSNDAQLAEVLEGLLTGRTETRPVVERALARVNRDYNVAENTKALGELFLALRG